MFRTVNRYRLNFRYAFQFYKPFLIYRLIKTYLRIFFLRKIPLRYVDFAIDYRCNLKCGHCFATALNSPKRQPITSEEFSKIVKEAMQLGAVNFSFQGGEPTIFSELDDFIKAAQPRKNLISVTTNATLLNEGRIKELKHLGVDIFTISLDSGIPQEHDRFRGVEGTFNKTLETIRLALKNGLKVTIGATLSHQNIYSEGFIKLVELAHNFKIIIFVAFASPLGEWQGREDVLLTRSDKEYLKSLCQKYPLLRTDFEANFIHHGCGAVKEILYLTAYGDVLACPFLHFSLGNIKESSLKHIRDNALKYDFFSQYYSQCLAAQDRGFIKKLQENPFYKINGFPVTLQEIFDLD